MNYECVIFIVHVNIIDRFSNHLTVSVLMWRFRKVRAMFEIQLLYNSTVSHYHSQKTTTL